MDLSRYNFEKEEDKIVFKSLIRAFKETNNFIETKKIIKSLNDLIEKCYLSRHVHKNESFFTNIQYWPCDTGIMPSKNGCLFTYLYLILLIEHFNSKDLNLKFKKTHEGIYNKPLIFFESYNFNFNLKIYGFRDLIINALVKAGCEEKHAIEQTNDLMLLNEAANLNIPF